MIGAAAFLMLALASGAAGGQGVPRFESSVETVYVDAFVSEGGDKPVSGLRAENFEIRDNGVLQRPRLVTGEESALDAVLVFDVSESVRGGKLEGLRRAAGSFVEALGPADRARLLPFAHDFKSRKVVVQDVQSLRRSLSELRASGFTSLHDAIYAGLELAGSSRYRGLLLVFSDGEDTTSWLSAEQVLTVARESDVLVCSVAVAAPPAAGRSALADRGSIFDASQTFGVNPTLGGTLTYRSSAERWSRVLEALATETGGRSLKVMSGAELEGAFSAIRSELKHRYLLAFEPEGVARSGWHSLDVRLKARSGKVRARRGYFGRPSEIPNSSERQR